MKGRIHDPHQFGQFVTEATKEGHQTLVPGVAPVRSADRVAWLAGQPMLTRTAKKRSLAAIAKGNPLPRRYDVKAPTHGPLFTDKWKQRDMF